MNIPKGNMYNFVTHTWNTVKGICPHRCSYCYMKNWGKQNPIRFDEKELRCNLGTGNFIFVGSSNDLFAKDIPSLWIQKTIDHCNAFNNRYLFQTKNPERFKEFTLPDNSVVCTTIETNRVYPEIMINSPIPSFRAASMSQIDMPKYVTIEPILDFDLDEMVELIRMCHPIQVNIGADSGGNHLPEPDREKVLNLIDGLKQFTVIEKKTNLGRLFKNRRYSN